MPNNSEVHNHSEFWVLSKGLCLFHLSGNCGLEMVPRFWQNLWILAYASKLMYVNMRCDHEVSTLATRWCNCSWYRIYISWSLVGSTESFAVDFKVPAASLCSNTLGRVTVYCAFTNLHSFRKWQTSEYSLCATDSAPDWAELLHKPLRCYRNKATVFSMEEPNISKPGHFVLTWSVCSLFCLTCTELCVTDSFHWANCELIFLHLCFKMSADRCKVQVP